jgi:nucleoside-diphosphate-sugar epimerase
MSVKKYVINFTKDQKVTLGHGDNCPLSDYISLIRNIINRKLELGIEDVPFLNSKVPSSSCVNLDLLVKDTGFHPKIYFNKGIIKVINRMKNTSP